MHVTLTDVLSCPKCGPGHGLILLPEEVRDRRVATGFLGCPDCRTRYPVVAGVTDLVVGAALEGVTPGGDETGATRLAAVLGLEPGRGAVVLAGPAAAQAEALAGLVEGIEVVATTDRGLGSASAVRLGEALPFQSGRVRGVVLSGAAVGLLEEAARVLSRGGRLLLDPAPPDAERGLAASGMRILAEQDGALVAARE